MKKLFILLFLTVLSINTMAIGFSYGVKAGWNYSQIKGSGISADAQQGIHAGLYGNFSLAIVAIQPEILYSQKGYKVSGANDVRMNYIDVPVIVKLKLIPFISIDAGPQFSYLINTKELSDLNTLPAIPSYDKSQFDGVVGLSTKVWRVGASARYIFGLQELESTNKTKNSMIQLSLQFEL